MKKYFPNGYNGVKIKFMNTLDNEELTLIKTMDDLLLHPTTYEKYGYYTDWVDINNEIPEELKNEDNIVLDPDTNQELLQYVITDGNQYINGKYNEGSYEYEPSICKEDLRASCMEVHDFF